MKIELIAQYRCPATHAPLTLVSNKQNGDEVISGVLKADDAHHYPIQDGVPDFTYPKQLAASDAEAKAYYDVKADEYDAYLPLTFETFGVDEIAERNRMIDDLCLKPDSVVLETGAGSGRDSELILKRLGAGGKLFVQDISPKLFEKARQRLSQHSPAPAFFLSNACYLPFPDKMFDAVYHFGGLNTFSDISRAFKEAVRVTKHGGKVVMGDESMPPWLRDSEFGKVLMNSNPHYVYPLPLAHLPVEARETRLRWIIGEVFYVIDFVVGVGTPPANLDFPIPGPRGGTHRTRYYGRLEGVSEEAKRAAHDAATRSGKSMHDWLSELVLREAEKKI